ncbi:MAG: rhodanese-like domain-containing protein [Anaerolineae bacterium]|jgi:rhodanese-related sulfurtransferase
MKKLALLNLVLVLSLLLGTAALAQDGDFGVIQRTAEAQLDGWSPVISADALYENLNDGDDSNNPFIVSVRAPDAYELGHIPGAINIPWKTIAKPESLAKLPTDQPIVVYCYTGHTGQISATVLRMLGYDVQNLKFGMMGWTLNDEVLSTTRYDPATSPDYPLETEPNEATETYDYPVVNTGESDAQEIVRAAADAWLNSEDSTPIVSADSVFENLSDGDDSNNPVILSVRAPDAYALGHVPGAINIPWSQIASPENLAKLPADQPILAYCYTGHTGQVATTVLGLLGYDVSNMKYGMMGWTQDDEVLATARYDPATAPDYPVEGTAVAAAAEETAAEEATPVQLPETGGMPIPVEGLVMGLGALTAAAGLYLRRRNAA